METEGGKGKEIRSSKSKALGPVPAVLGGRRKHANFSYCADEKIEARGLARDNK